MNMQEVHNSKNWFTLTKVARPWVKDLSVESLATAWFAIEAWGHRTASYVVEVVMAKQQPSKAMAQWSTLERQDQALLYSGALLALVLLFVKIRGRHGHRHRLDSSSAGGGSFRMYESTSASRTLRDRKASGDGLFQNAVNTKALGPNVPSISYETWTPPAQWKDASKKLLPAHIKPKPPCKVHLQLPQGTLLIQQVKDAQYDISKLSLVMRRPAASGIVEIIHEVEAMEHTFHSAYQAAQFQHDILAYQVVGQQLNHIYDALELLHKGSLAHVGSEPILHHVDATAAAAAAAADAAKGAVAWDDVMRCLGSTPVRGALEKLHNSPHADTFTALPSLHEDYRDRRALLGPVDFFRLYCPVLPETAIPKLDSHPVRMDYYLKLRKQVAEAAVLVHAYVLAKQVANKGWEPWPEQTMLRRRIAFDDDRENQNWDRSAYNEYYEATVSRDVQCEGQHPSNTSMDSHQSAYQAFSLVGCQIFQLAKDGQKTSPFSHNIDPVIALPNLRELICDSPDLDFFVCAFFPEKSQVAVVKAFVRSLPRGVDPAFDLIWKRFHLGDANLRDRKLLIFTQLGPRAKVTPMVWVGLKAVSSFYRWSTHSEPSFSFESSTADRRSFPGMNMSKYMETHHYGGALQTNPEMPGNYVAVTAHVDTSNLNIVLRTMYQKLEKVTLPRSTIDFTFILEGETKDELPERALGTVRLARVNPVDCALPIECSSEPPQLLRNYSSKCAVTPLRKQRSIPMMPSANRQSFTGLSALTTIISSWNLFSFGNTDEEVEALLGDEPGLESFRGVLDAADPFKAGVSALAEILEDVHVLVRRAGLTPQEKADATSISDDVYDTRSLLCLLKKEDLCNLAVSKKLTKFDLRRFYLGAECDLKTAAVRVVESMAWRGLFFPIDVFECRIELQNGQFFQQGKDLHGNPVFYFQCMCLGPWRKDEDALIKAVLHRLEASIQHYSEEEPDMQCTIVILLGKPVFHTKKIKVLNKAQKKKLNNDTSTNTTEPHSLNKAEDEERPKEADEATSSIPLNHANPRLGPGEDYYVHANMKVFVQLLAVLLKHYPERLFRAIIVPGKGGPGHPMIKKFIPSARTRAKVTYLHHVEELTLYVSRDEMKTLVGGNAPVHPFAYES